MTRILADLPEDDIAWLDACAVERGVSRAAILREAVSAYKTRSPAGGNKSWIARGAGYWKDRSDIGDSVEYQRNVREDRTPHKDI